MNPRYRLERKVQEISQLPANAVFQAESQPGTGFPGGLRIGPIASVRLERKVQAIQRSAVDLVIPAETPSGTGFPDILRPTRFAVIRVGLRHFSP